MSVYTPEGSDALVGLLFQSPHGAFAREEGRWTLLDPSDPRFDGLVVYDVLPANNDEALAAFDAGEAVLSDVQSLLAAEPIRPEDTEEEAGQ